MKGKPLTPGNKIANNFITLLGVIKDMPRLSWYMLESLLKSWRLVLLLDSDRRDIIYSADKYKLDPALEFTVSVEN